MTVSSLASRSILSPNAYYPRAYEITRITPHHTAFVGTAEQIAACFSSTSRQASCNYAIGNDGDIICVVEEQNGAWTSSSWDNDNRAVTVEISDADYDWNISPEAIEAYIQLCVDLIQRYPGLGGEYRWTGDLSGNVTAHRWFAATTCPGDPLYNMQSEIAAEVNRRLKGRGALPMEFILHPDECGHLFYVNGNDISYIPHPDGVVAIDKLAEKAGTKVPHIEIGTLTAPWGLRFFQACGQEALYKEIVYGEKPTETEQPTQSAAQMPELSAIGEALAQLGEALRGL